LDFNGAAAIFFLPFFGAPLPDLPVDDDVLAAVVLVVVVVFLL